MSPTTTKLDDKSATSHKNEKRMPAGAIANPALTQQLLDAFDKLFGLHAGFRPAHAKGLMCSGVFTPSPEGVTLTKAPHANRPSTPVTVRFSNSTGLPTIADNDPHAGPHGIAIRFHLDEHVHTDIIGHSADGFPVRTGEEFLELLHAAASAAAGRPEAIGAFLTSHPAAKRFEEMPKPAPTSFARENYFAVTSFKFTNASGNSCHGRFRIRPESGTEYLTDEEAASKSPNFLFDEITERLAKGSFKLKVFVRTAEVGDNVADATDAWPENRAEVPFGEITVMERVDEQDPGRRKIIFDPLPRVDGIDSSGDPLTQVRADLYLLSGRRRRGALGDGKR
jgi:catalase